MSIALQEITPRSRPATTLNQEECWQAILNKDSNFEGLFFYAVRSTGVFCRPTCPSRHPKRENVVFFNQTEAALQAGFRACQRCQPLGEEPVLALVKQACQYIEANFNEPLTLEDLGSQLGVSPFHLQRVFKRVMGISPRQYIEGWRLKTLKNQLREGDAVTEALYEAGFSSSSRLYERAPAQLGMTPAVYRKGGLGMNINYTIVDCSLGRLLVAATERGICAVSLGDSDQMVESVLVDEYPAATIGRDDTNLGEWVSAILAYLNGQKPHLQLPLDVQASAFKWRVWQELQNIPYGSTRTYSQVAAAIGNPKAVRAVANACASNPAVLVTPCHRVVREDGSLAGYRWGVERKRRLLEQEQARLLT
jgi:AraC family transcriptional regulator of adaptative response/methylated-DNA-[protein]-cysteine methyltransferase